MKVRIVMKSLFWLTINKFEQTMSLAITNLNVLLMRATMNY